VRRARPVVACAASDTPLLYCIAAADGEDQIADAVVVKSYRDSATYKRRHGIPLEAGEVDDEPDAAPQGDGSKRGRGRSAAAAETAQAADRGGRRRGPVEAAGKSGRGQGPSRPHHAPDLGGRGSRGAPQMHGPGPVSTPSLPPWVSRLPELTAARATPLHAWTSHSLRSALRKDGAAGPGRAPVDNGHEGGRAQKGLGRGRAGLRAGRPLPFPQSAAAAAAVAASDALADAGWMTDSGQAGVFGEFYSGGTLVSVPWHHDAF
jgi:hypothetical protein